MGEARDSEFEKWFIENCDDIYASHPHRTYIKACMETAWAAARRREWKSMSDDPPKNNEDILVLDEGFDYIVVAWVPATMMWLDRYSFVYKPRCWHPLPEALSYEEVEAIGK